MNRHEPALSSDKPRLYAEGVTIGYDNRIISKDLSVAIPDCSFTVIVGANVLRGSARLVDPSTGQLVGEYEIGQTVIGGRIAVVEMAEAEEQMSDAFGEELCEQAF